MEDVTSPYYTFKYSIRSELTRKYYERRIRTFFDFTGFLNDSDIEKRCNFFAQKSKSDNNWASIQIIRFLQYEKLRVEKSEITAATLSNFVKSIKLFCEMSEIDIHWKKITRGLPRPRAVASDRAPTIEELNIQHNNLNIFKYLKKDLVSADLLSLIESFLKLLREYGVFIVPVGELESWLPIYPKNEEWITNGLNWIETNGQ